jgi:hypothetical protein
VIKEALEAPRCHAVIKEALGAPLCHGESLSRMSVRWDPQLRRKHNLGNVVAVGLGLSGWTLLEQPRLETLQLH